MADLEGFKEARDIDITSGFGSGAFHIKGSSHLDWGMKNRLSRIIKPDTGRTGDACGRPRLFSGNYIRFGDNGGNTGGWPVMPTA